METCWRCLAEVPAQKILSHKQRCRGRVHGVVGLWNQTASLGQKQKTCKQQCSLDSLTARGSRRRARCVGSRNQAAAAFQQTVDLARRRRAAWPRTEPAPLPGGTGIVLCERVASAHCVPSIASERNQPDLQQELSEEVTEPYSSDEDQLCAICFEKHADAGDRLWLPCCHNFHEACVLPWLRERLTCPTCRHDFGSTTESDAESETLSEVSFFGY